MPVYCDECTKELPLNDEVFTDTGGAICRDCKGKASARKAMAMMYAYPENEKYLDQAELMTDMLADLFHYMKQHHIDHEAIMASARMHFCAEASVPDNGNPKRSKDITATVLEKAAKICALEALVAAQDLAIKSLEEHRYQVAVHAKGLAAVCRSQLAALEDSK